MRVCQLKYSLLGCSPYPRIDAREMVNLLQEGYRMPKPQHVDDKLYDNIVLLFFFLSLHDLFPRTVVFLLLLIDFARVACKP